MQCKSCGANLAPNTSRCPACGAPVSGTYQQGPQNSRPPQGAYRPDQQMNSGAYQPPAQQQPQPQQQPMQPQNIYNNFNMAPPKKPMSVGGWIGRSLIPCIPFVGGIIYIIMLFVWRGDTTREDSFRNWATAQLIFMAIGIVLGILIGILFGVMGVSLLDGIENMGYTV